MRHERRVLACAKRPAVASWGGFLGTTLLRSTGAPGSYAEAATSAAARVVFGGTSPRAFTVAYWLKTTSSTAYPGGYAIDISDNGTPRLSQQVSDDSGPDFTDIGFLDSLGNSLGPEWYDDWSSFNLQVFSDDGAGSFRERSDGLDNVEPSTALTTFAAVDALTLFADYLHANPLAGDLAGFAIFDRALTALEVAALAVGVTVDPRTLSGGGPVHWWPGDGDSGTTVTDRGSVGGCNLMLHGGVSIVGP